MTITSKYDEETMAKRIALVEKYLGESSDPLCRHCEWPVTVMGSHAPDCALRAIDPMLLSGMIHEARDEVIKTINRQLIYKGEVKSFSMGPPRQKTACRKQRPKIRKPKEDLKRCHICLKQRLFINGICQTCQHSAPCTWNWDEKPCPVCHIGKHQKNKKS